VGNKKTIGSRQAIRFNCLDGETNVRRRRRRRRTEMEEKLGEDVSLSLSRKRIMTAAAVGKDKKKRQVGTLGDEAAPCRRRPTPWETHRRISQHKLHQ
jgi:dihydropteroate synthase